MGIVEYARCSVHSMMSPFKTLEFNAVKRMVAGRKRIIDIGCGGGTQTMAMRRGRDYIVGVDPCPSAVAKARHLGLKVGDGNQMFSIGAAESHGQGGGFDAVTMICVLEHIKDHDAALRSAHDSLAPGGVIALTCDGWPIKFLPNGRRHAKDHAVEKYYSPSILATALLKAGFADVEAGCLFRSQYARVLFNKCLGAGFKRGPVRYFPELARLSAAEAVAPHHGAGLFVWGRAVRRRKEGE